MKSFGAKSSSSLRFKVGRINVCRGGWAFVGEGNQSWAGFLFVATCIRLCKYPGLGNREGSSFCFALNFEI